MADSYWKSGQPRPPRTQMSWPSAGQASKQLLTSLVIVGLWSGLFVGFMGFMTPAATPTPPPVVAQIEPTATNTLMPTATELSQPTETPVPTDTPTMTRAAPDPASETQANEPTEIPATPTSEPSPTATNTPTLEPTSTDPPPESTVEPAPVDEVATEVSFSQDVFPIFDRRCVKCHGGERPEGGQRIEEGLNMLTYEDIMAGSWNGSVVEPGDAEDSYLIQQIESGDMPKKGPRLLPGEIRLITQWIAAGALDN